MLIILSTVSRILKTSDKINREIVTSILQFFPHYPAMKRVFFYLENTLLLGLFTNSLRLLLIFR